MKIRFTRLRVVAIAIIVLLVLGLAIWTATSPQTLEVQSPSQLQTSLLSYSKSFQELNFSDGSGSYSFRLGFDYSSNISIGSKTQLAVYCALVNETISSPLTKGIALGLQSSSLLVDGSRDAGVSLVSRLQAGLETFYFQNPNTNIALGMHNFTARLIISMIDVNFIGNFETGTELVSVSGIINMTS